MYNELKEKAKEVCYDRVSSLSNTKACHTRITLLKREIATAERNIADETNNVTTCEYEISKLKESAGDSLTDGQRKTNLVKFSDSLGRLNARMATAKEAIKLIVNDIIPDRRAKIAEQNVLIDRELNRVNLVSVSPSDIVIAECRIKMQAERDGYVEAMRQLYKDNGKVFIWNTQSVVPGDWEAAVSLCESEEPEKKRTVVEKIVDFVSPAKELEPAMELGSRR